LNANYLLARLREEGVLERLPLAYGELCGHEFVLSGAPMKRELGIRTLDLAKRLLDHGIHPPTPPPDPDELDDDTATAGKFFCTAVPNFFPVF